MQRGSVLEIINKVMRKMGVDEVSAINETSFSTVLVEYLNDVLDMVADFGEWPNLRHVQTYAITSTRNTYQTSVTGGHFRNIQAVRVSGKSNDLKSMHPLEIERVGYLSTTGTPWGFAVIDSSSDDPVIKVHPMESETLVVSGFLRQQYLDVSAATSTGAYTPPWHMPLLVKGLHAQALWHEGGNTDTPEFTAAMGLFIKGLQAEFSKFTTDTGVAVQFYAPRR